MGNLGQVEETSSNSRSAERLDLVVRLGWAAGRAGSSGRCARSVCGSSFSCSLHNMITDLKRALADFAILNQRTHAGHLNVDAGRTNAVVAMDL